MRACIAADADSGMVLAGTFAENGSEGASDQSADVFSEFLMCFSAYIVGTEDLGINKAHTRQKV